MNNPFLSSQDVEYYLSELGAELQQRGTGVIRVLMVGGAYMLTQTPNRAATKDVDVLLLDIDDPALSPDYPQLQSAVRAVASVHQLPTSWFNDVVGDALRMNGPIPSGTLWKSYDKLEIYIPPSDYMLALKLLAGRPQDVGDIRSLVQSLQVTSRAEAQQVLDRYIDQGIQTANNASDTLDRLFP